MDVIGVLPGAGTAMCTAVMLNSAEIHPSCARQRLSGSRSNNTGPVRTKVNTNIRAGLSS